MSQNLPGGQVCPDFGENLSGRCDVATTSCGAGSCLQIWMDLPFPQSRGKVPGEIDGPTAGGVRPAKFSADLPARFPPMEEVGEPRSG